MYLTVLLPPNCVVSCCICVLWGGFFIVVLSCYTVLFTVYTIIYVNPPSPNKIGILPHMFCTCTCTYFFIVTWRIWVYYTAYIYIYIHVTKQGMVRGHGLRLASTSPEWSENWIGELDNYPRIAELHRTSKVSELFYTVYVIWFFVQKNITTLIRWACQRIINFLRQWLHFLLSYL